MVLMECTVAGNGGVGVAGGMDSWATMVDCEITDNAGTGVGAEYMEFTLTRCVVARNGGTGAYGWRVIADSCVFDENERSGLWVGSESDGGEGHVENCRMSRNGSSGLGVYGNVTVRNCDITENERGGISSGACHLELTLSRVTDNRRSGLSVWCDGYARVDSCEFVGNSTDYRGGAIHAEGWWCDPSIEISNSTLVGNSAPKGGAIACWTDGDSPEVHLDVDRCTIADNSADSGSVLHIEGPYTYASFRRSIIAFNRLESSFVLDAVLEEQPAFAACNVYATAALSSVDIIDEGENFSVDPWFCDREAGDYTLLSVSPCLAGNSPTGEQVGALGQGCTPDVLEVKIVPRMINAKSRESVMATVGGADDIVVSTIRLQGVVRPIVASAPVDTTLAPTGGKDGSSGPVPVSGWESVAELRFDVGELIEALGPIEPRREYRVTLTAQRSDGRPVRGNDVVRFVHVGGNSAADSAAAAGTAKFVRIPSRSGFISVTPNPFNPVTRIRYGAMEAMRVRLAVYDVKGRLVAELVDEVVPAGEHEAVWEAGGVASGVYFSCLEIGEERFTRKLVVVK
jgi:hypothetical protein